MKTTYKKKTNLVMFQLSGSPAEVGDLLNWIETFRATMRAQMSMQEEQRKPKYTLNVSWTENDDRSVDHADE